MNNKVENVSSVRKQIPVPKIVFEKWIDQEDENGKRVFNKLEDILETKEWKEIYSNYYHFNDNQLNINLSETKEDLENYDIQTQIQELIRCTNDFWYFCVKYVKINHPVFGTIRFMPYIYQNRVIECYNDHRFNILSKFRQGGLTTVSVLWALWKCMFGSGQRIMIVSKTDREAIAAGDMAKTAVEYLPSWLKPETDKFNEHEKQFKTTNSVLWCYTIEACRGKSISILIIDEAAFIPDMKDEWKAIYPVISTGGRCAAISTVNGLGNWYEETYHEAESGKGPFNIINIDYWEHPLYNDPKWIEETKSVLQEDGWAQEVERCFIGSGETWAKADVISNLMKITDNSFPEKFMFEKWKNKNSEKKFKGDEGALWIWKTPISGREYLISADCAEGIGNAGDNSAFQVLDLNTLEQVAEFYSNSIPPHEFALLLHQLGLIYNTAEIVIENNTHGAVVLNILHNEINYENLFYEEGAKNPGVKTTKLTRPKYLQSLQQKLMNGTIKINSKRFVNELNTFIFNVNTKKPEARRGCHDDSIISLAIACYVRDLKHQGFFSATEEKISIFKDKIFEEIKNEIIQSDLDDLFDDNEDLSENDFMNTIYYVDQNVNDKKYIKKNKILQEFGW